MATISILNPLVDPLSMAARRAPLASVPNAVNSPFRAVALPTVKRTRAQAGDQVELIHGQPPQKKQVIELLDEDVENVDPRRRNGVPAAAQDKLDDDAYKRGATVNPSELQNTGVAARERRIVQQASRTEAAQKAHDENLASLRLWQRHYRQHFPQFVFYFESVPEESRLKFAAHCRGFGAKEAKFFSKDVTHVITTRAIPESSSNTQDSAKQDDSQSQSAQPARQTLEQRRPTDLLDANLQRRAQNQASAGLLSIDPRKVQVQNTDVLSRARAMGIKIWALEKLQRVVKTMLISDGDESTVSTQPRARVIATKTMTRQAQAADLEQLLRNEKVNGPADRDMSVVAQDMITLKGYYLYIFDMDEKTKPVMVRDYEKTASKEEGKWPQFRLTSAGRCPFVEDPTALKKLQLQEKEAAKAEVELASQRKTRAATGNSRLRPLTECETNLRRSPRKPVQQVNPEISKPLDPPRMIPVKRQSSTESAPRLFGNIQHSLRGNIRMIGGEPVASGIQQSNITSAIRSQVISSAAISSTAAGIPKRIGDSREVTALKRKVLERSANATSNHSMPSSYMNDIRAAINGESTEPPPRAAKRRAQETLGVVHEDPEEGTANARIARCGTDTKAKKPEPKEPKPGYCENCRDKFEDFDEHVNSRKHRKFALTSENFKELDELLMQLKRPHKVVCGA